MTDYIDPYEHSRKQDNASYEMNQLFEWEKWGREIPYIPLKRGWKIKVTPPFGGAVVRFMVSKGDDYVSVYLDCYDKIGCMDNKPYWEIHPSEDGDCERFWMNEIDELVDGIDRSFNQNNWINKLRKMYRCWRS
jgi:hypothetical protein